MYVLRIRSCRQLIGTWVRASGVHRTRDSAHINPSSADDAAKSRRDSDIGTTTCACFARKHAAGFAKTPPADNPISLARRVPTRPFENGVMSA
jgi:hypothetical protein